VELTEAGRVFLPEAKAILAAADRAVSLARYAASSASGRIVIGPGTEGAVLAKVLPAPFAPRVPKPRYFSGT
jgi:DNA-binding transcriptional LysR family regulator